MGGQVGVIGSKFSDLQEQVELLTRDQRAKETFVRSKRFAEIWESCKETERLEFSRLILDTDINEVKAYAKTIRIKRDYAIETHTILRDLAKERRLPNYSRLDKAELIHLLLLEENKHVTTK